MYHLLSLKKANSNTHLNDVEYLHLTEKQITNLREVMEKII